MTTTMTLFPDDRPLFHYSTQKITAVDKDVLKTIWYEFMLLRFPGVNPDNIDSDALEAMCSEFVARTGHTIQSKHLRLTLLNLRKNTKLKSSSEGNIGEFYMSVMDFEARPNRVKMGFTTDVFSNTSGYKRSSPEVVVLAKWPCDKAEERATALAIAKKFGAAQLVTDGGPGREVYDFPDAHAAAKWAMAKWGELVELF